MLANFLSTKAFHKTKNLVIANSTRWFKRHYDQVKKENVTMYGTTNTTVQWLTDFEKDNMPNFAVRRFEISKGGTIQLHSHNWEHQFYMLEGKNCKITNGSDYTVSMKPGEIVFVPPNEPHSVINQGDDTLVILCMVPNYTKK
ncbi:oxalate-binding protein [Anaeramoeba flamelloides]|uniref:Oxalate-binding protein n=1 Tax=Anaeramoeba flamelloides TaxID=1746091 RepID=A0ABQ8ZB53_9EUKA|nr:oxalate-binding protein [Anaeramoeba flamelloides]